MTQRKEPRLPAWQIVMMYVTLGLLLAGAIWVNVVDLARHP
jgi:hypothetical protein